jgi:ribosomal protein L24
MVDVEDNVRVPSGRYAGKIGMVLRTNTHSDARGATYTAVIMLPDGTIAGTFDAKKLEKIVEAQAETDEEGQR